MVYAAQPREGTETHIMRTHFELTLPRFMQLNPARGRKQDFELLVNVEDFLNGFMQLNPARGRKHSYLLCFSFSKYAVYAAQPREGTETFA